MKKWSSFRSSVILVFFAILYTLVVFRLFYWQVVRADELKRMGINQSSESLEVSAKRGDILTSDGFPLATTKASYLLYANPKIVKYPKDYSSKLSEILKVDEATVSAELSKNLYWVKLAENLDRNEKSRIDALNLKGLGFQEDDIRYYPEASMAAHLLGFLGKDSNGNDQGYFGLEGYYNDQLAGRSGSLSLIHDALGNPILNDMREEKKIDGRNLKLNIDRTVQYFAEEKLKEGIEKYEAEGGSVLVMEPSTGKVLAMVSLPEFDPQTYYKFDASSYKNPAISDLYEPGSTFKVLVMAAAINEGLVKPDTKCDICSGPVKIGEYNIKTWDNKYYPDTTMTDVIQHSDNTGMVFVGRKLGVNKMIQYLKGFGIDELTNIDLQGEVSGTLRDEDKWYPIDLATSSFGQGISVTPIQLLTAVSAIANGGNIVKPYVVSQVITEGNKVIDIKPEIKKRVISDTTAKVMVEIMVNAVNNGESKWTKIDGYKIAGKTGTAQIPIQGHYDANNTIASFVGFFPADNPKISMLVLVNKPKSSIYGAETAAPIFFSIARDLINYYNIPPSD